MTQRLTDTSPRRAHAARFGAELSRAMAERGRRISEGRRKVPA